MKRNIKTLHDEYVHTFGSNNKHFNTADLDQLREINTDLVNLIVYALECGFMAGYKAAKREARQKSK